jgi:hypothetical protein
MSHNKHVWWHQVITIIYVLGKGLAVGAFWFGTAVAGYVILVMASSPINLAAGIPMLGLGWGFLVHLVWSDLLVIFSPKFNEGICALCMWRRRRWFR